MSHIDPSHPNGHRTQPLDSQTLDPASPQRQRIARRIAEGTVIVNYEPAGVPASIECHVYCEKGYRATWDDPGQATSGELQYAYLNGVDITYLLSDEHIDRIERLAAEQLDQGDY